MFSFPPHSQYLLVFLSVLLYLSNNVQATPTRSTTPIILGSAAIRRASNISAGNPAKCAGGTRYFPQPIDYATFIENYADDNSTFLQQIEITPPGGPVFLHLRAHIAVLALAKLQNGLRRLVRSLLVLSIDTSVSAALII
jgi:hypothetical protein